MDFFVPFLHMLFVLNFFFENGLSILKIKQNVHNWKKLSKPEIIFLLLIFFRIKCINKNNPSVIFCFFLRNLYSFRDEKIKKDEIVAEQ